VEREEAAGERVVHLVRDVVRVNAGVVRPGPLHLRAELRQQRHHRLDVADARQVRQRHRLVGQETCGEDRQRAVLVPGRAQPTRERMASFDQEGLRHRSDDGRGHEADYASSAVNPTRDQAWETLTRYTKSEALLRHALAVEASTAWYARKLGEDEELWRVTALLHDFDYEMHPTLDKHPQDGAPILREEGYPEEVIDAVLSHANHLSVPRDTPLKKTLFACDELSGFVHACGLVRPTGLEGLEPKSVKKKLKQPSFAAGVSRDDVYEGADLLGLELDEHIANVVEALQPIAPELGLRVEAA
jgi:putative nucleotidyltransferase with HDIG domain